MMTPKEAYETKGQNPKSGIWVNEWHAYGSVFMPNSVKVGEGVITGMRTINSSDIASGFVMDIELVAMEPDAITGSQIISFIERVIKGYSKPSRGVIISHSCWLSSCELVEDEDTEQQGLFLESEGIKFDSMSQNTKDELLAWGRDNDLIILFDANEIPVSNLANKA